MKCSKHLMCQFDHINNLYVASLSEDSVCCVCAICAGLGLLGD
jgi:hypothetical protein